MLLLPYPSQSHINPLLQFSKRLASKGLKATLATTIFVSKTIINSSSSSGALPIQFDTISDGYDHGGGGADIMTYMGRLEEAGSETLAELITRHKHSPHPIDCIVYDLSMHWALDVAKQFDIVSAAFSTLPCTVTFLYYCLSHGLFNFNFPFSSSSLPVSISGLSFLELHDMPSFVYNQRTTWSGPKLLEVVLKQFSNADKADFILVNTVYAFEKEVGFNFNCISQCCMFNSFSFYRLILTMVF